MVNQLWLILLKEGWPSSRGIGVTPKARESTILARGAFPTHAQAAPVAWILANEAGR